MAGPAIWNLVEERCREMAVARGGLCLAEYVPSGTTPVKWRCASGHTWDAPLAANGRWCPVCAQAARKRSGRGREENCRRIVRSRRGEVVGFTDPKMALRSRFRIRCTHLHTFDVRLDWLLAGAWCPECARKEDAQQRLHREWVKARMHAMRNGGELLTGELVDPMLDLEWRCVAGHTFHASWFRVQRWGPFCETCEELRRTGKDEGLPAPRDRRARTSKYDLAMMREVAARRGGRCLSTNVYGPLQRLEWECAKGHRWKAAAALVAGPDGTWCMRCRDDVHSARQRKYTLEMMQEAAAKQGGRCLSTTVHRSSKPLEWECARGHRWKARGADVARPDGTWCPQCRDDAQAARLRKHTIAMMREVAAERGGRCLSTDVHRSWEPLEWECAKGHRWKATVAAVVQVGRWCPGCRDEATAVRMRKHSLEDCNALVAAKGGRCLSERFVRADAKLEWECANGHRFEKSFNSVKKGCWCRECKWAAGAEERERKRIARNLALRVKVRKPPRIKGTLKEMQQRARALGGRCLATEYHGVHRDIEWECAEGHRWFGRPSRVGVESWCRICAARQAGRKRRRHTLAECRELARARGGKCLSRKYPTPGESMEWECAEGHRWFARATVVAAGKWCRICGHQQAGLKLRRFTLADCQELARARGGKCLSKEYAVSMEWECAEGHRFRSRHTAVRHGSWCRICAHKEIARRRRRTQVQAIIAS